jgi:diaminohydroxyphosphoribosylaminopyrimidine deaminase/5-amino-6-(5-phosphoribosylamino)uracil reductase
MQPNLKTDEFFMMRAIALARRGQGHTRPNPPVGAVVVADGEIIGEGWHRRCGSDHAEVAALKNAARRGKSAKGACVYVTLEPCSRPGRVGACTQALIEAGVARVVFACNDPNPENRGRAKRILSRAGIVCEHKDNVEAQRLIAPFAKYITTGMPFITVKLAMSLDGRICDNAGNAKWISSAAARKHTGRLRERVDAIMVGAATVRADDPVLLPHHGRNDDLVRVVVTRSGNVPAKAKVLSDNLNETMILKLGPRGNIRLAMKELGKRGFMHVLCEGGMKLAVSLAEAGLVDEWITVVAPCVIGNSAIGKKKLFTPVKGEKPERFGDDTVMRFVCSRG